MKRNITHKSRGRYLTPEEAAKYREIREQIEREKPEINAGIRKSHESRKKLVIPASESSGDDEGIERSVDE